MSSSGRPRPFILSGTSATIALACIAATPAAAQDLPQSEIVVTASKRAEPLAKLPMSISVVDARTLERANVKDFAGLARLVPGLSYIDSGPGNKRYALRGLQSAGEPEVALFYDETPISGIPGGSLDTGDSQLDLTLWDVERIEVLRGPQGTLYGNGSMGGAIRILSNRPHLGRVEAASEISAGVTRGGAPSFAMFGMLNVPLVQNRLALRVTAYRSREGGYIDDIDRRDIALRQTVGKNLNWARRVGGRGSLAFQATPTWMITAIGYYQDLRTGNSFETYPTFATASDRFVSKSYVRTPWHDVSGIVNLISATDLGWGDLTVTGSFQKRDVQRTTDTTRFLLTLFHCTEQTWQQTCAGPDILPAGSYAAEGVKAWSGEVRVASKGVAPLKWTAGAFWQDSRTYRHGQVATAGADGLIHFDPSTGVATGRLFARDNRDTFQQYALFGEAEYKLAPRVSASAGLRWFHSRRTDQQVIVQQFFPNQPTGAQPFEKYAQSALYKKFELTYEVCPMSLFYLEAAQGFRAGGPNFPGGFNLSAPAYRADSVWDYEAGWRHADASGRLSISGALFDIEWHDLQELVPTALFSFIANAGRARSSGFETQLSYKPISDLEFTGGVTWNRARLVGPQPLQTNPSLQLLAGDRLANVPEWTATGSTSYRWSLARARSLEASLDATYMSERGNLVSSRSASYRRIAPSMLLDAHLMFSSGGPWSVGLDITNLLNSFAPVSAKPLDSNQVASITPARPRTISVRLLVRK